MPFNLEGWTEFAFAMLETSKIILIKILSLIFNPPTYTVCEIQVHERSRIVNFLRKHLKVRIFGQEISI